MSSFFTTWKDVADIVQSAIDRKIVLSEYDFAFYNEYKDLKSYIDVIKKKSTTKEFLLEMELEPMQKKETKYKNIQRFLYKPLKVYKPEDILKYKVLI